jgi:arsenate reductase-like glutaredoxin family protein
MPGFDDPKLPAGDGPILYLSESSHACQLVRLVLAEKGVSYRLRSVNLSTLEQARLRAVIPESGPRKRRQQR